MPAREEKRGKIKIQEKKARKECFTGMLIGSQTPEKAKEGHREQQEKKAILRKQQTLHESTLDLAQVHGRID